MNGDDIKWLEAVEALAAHAMTTHSAARKRTV